MATDKQVIEFQVRLKDFMTKELARLGLTVEKTSKKGKKGFDEMGRSAEKAGRKIKKAGGGFKGFTQGLMKFGRALAAMTGLGAGLGGLITMFTKVRQGMQDAMAFSQAMAEVATISEVVRADTEGFTRAVLDLSTAFGQSELTTAKALYQTISAGFTDTAEAMYLVESASKLAVGGFAEINVVVDFLTGVINAYGKSVYEAEELTDLFFETVRVGKTTIPEMAKQMGAVMPIAANLGVSIEELSAMLATLTLGNIETSLATTYMRQALVAVLQPSEAAQQLMAANEFRFDSAKIAADGFVGVLKEMREKFGGNIAAMQKFFPNVRSFIPVLALAGNQWDKFNQILEEFKDLAGKEVTPTMQALETAMLSAGKKMEVLGNAARQGFMQLGMGLIEGLTGPITSVTELQDMAFVFRDAIAGLKPLVEGFTAVLIGSVGAMIYLFSTLADKMGLDAGAAKVLEDDLGNLSTSLFNMAGSVMGGGKSIGEAFEEMSHSVRSGRKELVTEALEARDALESVSSQFQPGWGQVYAKDIAWGFVDPADLAFGKSGMPERGALSDALLSMTLEEFEAVKGKAPLLQEKIKEHIAWRTLQLKHGWAKGQPGVPSSVAEIGQETLGAMLTRHYGAQSEDDRIVFEALVSNELYTLQQTLQTTWDAAELRVPWELGTEKEELARMLSFKDVVADAARDFVREMDHYEQIVEKTGFADPAGGFAPLGDVSLLPTMTDAEAQSVIDAYLAAGNDSAEAFYTALAFSMEDHLEGMPDNIKAIMEPKFKQAMGFIGSKAGRTLKAALMVGKAGGPITFSDIIEFKPEEEAALTTTIYNITKEMERQKQLMSDKTPEQQAEKELYLIDMSLQLKRAQIELDHRRGDQSKMLWGMDEEAAEAAIGRMRENIQLTHQFAIARRDLGKEMALAKLMPDLTPEQDTAKQLEIARLNMEAAVSKAEEGFARLALSGGEYMVLLDAIDQNYEETVDGIVNGTEKIGFAWQALQREAQNLDAEFENIKVHAVNLLVDGLAEGMMQMIEGAEGANESWKEFGRNFLRTIAIMIMRAYMLQAVMAAIGMFGGGGSAYGDPSFGPGHPSYGTGPMLAKGGVAGGGFGPVHAFAQGGMVPGGLGRMLPVGAYANGGVVNQPSYAIMGEGGRPEAILPLERMAGGDLGVKAGGGGGTNINISINAVDAKGVDELLVSRQDTLRNIIRQAMTESRSFRSTMLGQTAG